MVKVVIKVKLQKETQLQSVIQTLKDIPIIEDCSYELDYKINDQLAFDALISVDMKASNTFQIGLMILNNGYPSVVRQFYQKYQSSLDNQYFLISAPYVSETTSNLCKEYGISCIDLAGNCLLNLGSIYIDHKGNKNNHVSKRGLKSIYERSSVVSSKILRVLFADVNRPWKMKELSEYVGCSIGQVSKVKQFLAQKDQIKQTDEGFIITKPEEVLQEWAKVYGKNTDIIECYSMDNVVDIETKLINMKDKIGVDYYLTGFSGGVRYQPVVRYYKVHFYIHVENLDQVMSYLDCKRVDSGPNIFIIIPQDDSILMNCQYIDNSQIVSPVQMFLDCYNLKSRGEELAEAILEKEILNEFDNR